MRIFVVAKLQMVRGTYPERRFGTVGQALAVEPISKFGESYQERAPKGVSLPPVPLSSLRGLKSRAKVPSYSL